MRRRFFFVVMLGLSLPVVAQECWMMPSKFRYRMNETMPVAFLEGKNFDGEGWEFTAHRPEKLDWHRLAAASDLRKDFKPLEKSTLNLRLTQDGTQLLTVQSSYTIAEKDAEKFNGYLKEEGLDDVLKQRKESGSLDKPVRESSARFSKLIFQVGLKTDNTFSKKTGLRLEIVPLQNPYTLTTGDYLDCQVLLDGKPLPHQLIRVFNTIGNASFLQDIYTENDGTIRFPISARGKWMVSTVTMFASEKPDAEWQSLWSSLVFGI